jgi:dolichyl-phosphate beta-glucosyltransferase
VRQGPILPRIALGETLAEAAITVPCYNEADRLQCDVFIDFVREHREVMFIFVDDGSTDGTAQLLESLSLSESANIRLISLKTNCGKAEAVRQGTLSAIATGAKYVGYWDADLATPLNPILEFVAELKKKSDLLLVMGARVQLLGRTILRKRYRHYLGRVFATVASAVLRMPVYDTQCGAKMFAASEPVALAFRDPFISRWIFDVEILARLVYRGKVNPQVAIFEYPLFDWHDVRGSKIKPKDFCIALWDLAHIHFTYQRC